MEEREREKMREWEMEGKEGGTEGERLIFHLLIHSPNGFKGQILARLKPGVQDPTWISHTGVRDQSLGPSPTALPVASVGSHIKSGTFCT